MDQKWKILYYETAQGKSPVFDFISGLELKGRTKVSNTLDLLKEFGIKLGSPHAKKLAGTEVWELRVLGSDSIRILYVAVIGRNFLLLHGFKKKKQKTDRKDIKTAEDRLKDFKTRQKQLL